MAKPFANKQLGGFLTAGFVSAKTTKAVAKTRIDGYSIDTLHKNQCAVCPLNNQSRISTPHMPPAGTSKPLVYMLGAAPNGADDQKGEPFSGPVGRVLRRRIPRDWVQRLRWNNCVRTRPPHDREPTKLEIECCRPSIEEDIAKTKPKAIFGFGPIPLHWALQQSRITLWRGRYVPINVAGHSCWFFPIIDPQYVVDNRRFVPRHADQYGCEEEFTMALDLRNAFDIVDNLPEAKVDTREEALADIETVTNIDRLKELLKQARREKILGYDYETDRLRPFPKDSRILSVGMAGQDFCFAFPLEHPQSPFTPDEKETAYDLLEDFLYEAECTKVSHHLPFEMEWTGVNFGRKSLRAQYWDDTESQAYILDQRRGALSLDWLCQQYFGINLKSITGNLDTTKLADMPLDMVLQYNGLDARYHRKLFVRQSERLRDEGMEEVYREQLRRAATVTLTQIKGVPINAEINEDLAEKYTKQIKAVEKEINKLDVVEKFKRLRGYEYRPAAPHDIKYILTKMLKLDIRNDFDKESVDEDALDRVKHPIAKLTIDWRKANKLWSTYIKPMQPDSEIMFDGMIHPIFSITSTSTWRTSSEDPNAQNWPKHTKTAKEIRSQFHAKPGYKVVSFDYAGIQARNVAMESKDKQLVEVYWNDYDIHADWRDRLLRIYPKWCPGGPKAIQQDSDLAKFYRQEAKNGFVFASFFGAQAKTTSARLKVPENVMERLREEFFDEFPDIENWHQRIEAEYYDLGYVTGLSGFRRHAPVRKNERINAPIQADESIIVLDAMERLSATGNDLLQANLEVHDDLTFHWPIKKIDELADYTISTMLNVPYKWAQIVPIGVAMSIGDDWGNMEEIGSWSSDKWNGTRQERKRA